MGRDSEVGLGRSIESESEEEYTSSTLRMPREYFNEKCHQKVGYVSPTSLLAHPL